MPECSKKLLRQIDYLNWYFERRYQKNVIIVAKCIVLSAVCITDKMCSEERRAATVLYLVVAFVVAGIVELLGKI